MDRYAAVYRASFATPNYPRYYRRNWSQILCMELSYIIDLGRYPIDRKVTEMLSIGITEARKQFAKDGCVAKKGFLEPKAIVALAKERCGLASEGDYSERAFSAYPPFELPLEISL